MWILQVCRRCVAPPWGQPSLISASVSAAGDAHTRRERKEKERSDCGKKIILRAATLSSSPLSPFLFFSLLIPAPRDIPSSWDWSEPHSPWTIGEVGLSCECEPCQLRNFFFALSCELSFLYVLYSPQLKLRFCEMYLFPVKSSFSRMSRYSVTNLKKNPFLVDRVKGSWVRTAIGKSFSLVLCE